MGEMVVGAVPGEPSGKVYRNVIQDLFNLEPAPIVATVLLEANLNNFSNFKSREPGESGIKSRRRL